ncbi:hypothetical protein FIBSPDRAFT_926999 [Athelia psychrophila]|uniref:Uncharacterized protein n=1 Tax=Athelia psychrophila TaxID=1759441 RepID=A0A166SLK9_9AGAM|nr:hypothetical protein FIBSPDRAFT_926999 [Fibularhizoctonia sp. CBS 109695]
MCRHMCDTGRTFCCELGGDSEFIVHTGHEKMSTPGPKIVEEKNVSGLKCRWHDALIIHVDSVWACTGLVRKAIDKSAGRHILNRGTKDVVKEATEFLARLQCGRVTQFVVGFSPLNRVPGSHNNCLVYLNSVSQQCTLDEHCSAATLPGFEGLVKPCKQSFGHDYVLSLIFASAGIAVSVK